MAYLLVVRFGPAPQVHFPVMSSNGGKKAVLRGAKLPTWACSKCERTANWACRVVCQCGAKAPADVAKRARAAHDKLEAGGRSPKGPDGGGGGQRDLAAALAKLAKEVASLKQGAAATEPDKSPPPAQLDDPLQVQIEALEASHAG